MKKFFIGLAVFLVMIILGSILLYRRSIGIYNESQEQSYAYALEETPIVEPTEFYWYNGNETYFTVIGKSEQEETLVALINQGTGEVTTLPAEGLLSKQEAVQLTREARNPDKILEARIGMHNDEPIWEVSYRNEKGRLGYYVLSLETGEWIRTIDNI